MSEDFISVQNFKRRELAERPRGRSGAAPARSGASLGVWSQDRLWDIACCPNTLLFAPMTACSSEWLCFFPKKCWGWGMEAAGGAGCPKACRVSSVCWLVTPMEAPRWGVKAQSPSFFWDTAGNTSEGTVMGLAILVRSQLSCCLGLLGGLQAGLVRKVLLVDGSCSPSRGGSKEGARR